MQALLDRLIADGVFAGMPNMLVYTGMMFLCGLLVVFGFFLPDDRSGGRWGVNGRLGVE